MIDGQEHRPNSLRQIQSFDAALLAHGLPSLRRTRTTTLQVNVGKRCNMACLHCHVEAGPLRTEVMPSNVVERLMELLRRSPSVETLDLTGGAPELHPAFRDLVTFGRSRGLRVIDRCNLSVLFEPGQADTAAFLAAQGADIVASLPCYLEENVESQRGRGAFDVSIRALKHLNALGFGVPGSSLSLHLVYNPVGPHLPPPQGELEAEYRRQLGERLGIEFTGLLTITNMPMARFASALARSGELEAYQSLLARSFNKETAGDVMCRTLVSVAWDGTLHDCDFNQMSGIQLGHGARDIWSIGSLDDLAGAAVSTASHCFGCTAGAGSSCSGALR